MLDLQNIQKKYGAADTVHHALLGVSLTIKAGEFVALMGPSGCGKSTLLHISGAMDRATAGVATLAGQVLGNLSDKELAEVRRRQVGFVFQAFNLLPTLTAIENISLPLLLDRVSDKAARDKSQAALEQVGLAHKANSYPSQLSGGEMQRVAIARAIAIEPDLLIADEPTGSLDSENGIKVLNLLAELNQSLGLTVLMATHSEEAASYAGRRFNMRDGQLDNKVSADDHASAL